MKATGVIRRIDDLGRIVIPKEIRKNFKINEGDSLEIYVENNGIVLRKYSLLDDLVSMATHLVGAVDQIYKKKIVITNKEKIIATSKDMSFLLNLDLTSTLKDKMEERIEYCSKDKIPIVLNNNYDSSCFVVPILVDSDSIGSVILLDSDITESDRLLIHLITSILPNFK